MTQALDAARVSVGNAVQPSDVKLPNMPPEIIAVTAQSAGMLARTAAPGDSVDVITEVRDINGDPLTFEWVTMNGHGTISASAPGTAKWTLPNSRGTYSAYVQASDGRGGFSSRRIDFTTAKTEERFSGIVIDKESLARLKDAEVSVNGVTATTDANGFFDVNAPLGNRYVLNIERAGYAQFSRVVDAGLTGQTGVLQERFRKLWTRTARSFWSMNVPYWKKKRLRGSRVVVPADSLVDENGAAPSSKLTGYIATLDIGDGEAPGDWGAIGASGETNLISYGATFVEFRDLAGNKYNLKSGAAAKVDMAAPQSMVAGAPANSKLWSYDRTDGFWKENGSADFTVSSGVFSGKVTHFSTINTDVEKDDDACDEDTDLSAYSNRSQNCASPVLRLRSLSKVCLTRASTPCSGYLRTPTCSCPCCRQMDQHTRTRFFLKKYREHH